MDEVMRLTRATVANTRVHAIRTGLGLFNPGSSALADRSRIAVPFQRRTVGQSMNDDELLAVQIGKQERKIPVVIDLAVTPQNFELLQRRIMILSQEDMPSFEEPDFIQRASHVSETLLTSFSQLLASQGRIAINMRNIPHEDLIELGVKVGFRQGRRFVYKTYEEWANELNVRAETREEMRRSTEGDGGNWRK